MNVPAIAKQTFESLRNQPAFLAISHFIIEHLNKIKSSHERAHFVHNVIDEYNKEVFAHPILKELVPCKSGCTACCHTQVSVTDDEAALLISSIDGGVEIDYKLLEKQATAGNDPVLFFNIPYKERKCIFLDSAGGCRVYEDRPSVCRTNAVVGDASQCDTSNNQPTSMRLVKTSKADMAIFGAFYNAKESGTLPVMIAKLLKERFVGINNKKIQKPAARTRNVISKDHEL